MAVPRQATQAASIPTGLPGHFGVGVAAGPNSNGLTGWMPNSGIPWDYAYQYLSGGVNTGSGWETWNTSGQFPLYYAQSAHSHSYIPVFSYYELAQSTGSCTSCGEAQKDLTNLNTPSLMASYFANFRLLMQRLGSGTSSGITGYGGTTIVQVEPDLSGYAQQAVLNTGSCYGYCTAQGNNPSDLTAAVASSGDADVQNFPNTYQGLNWALLHLRDRYAPNVLLAFHLSDWTTGTDIGSNTSTTLDATSLGQEAGAFAGMSGTSTVPSGVTPYDLLFNDVADRDAGYYKYVDNNPTVWWDRTNVTFPNFHRWEGYVHAASQAAGKSVIVWQIPLGNQYFASENNTNGHYQDNRTEYFLSHIGELANAGIIGLLFGAGNGGSTVNYDGMQDGITNPSPVCTSDGTSSGQICANHTSTVSDDDGGYLRMIAQQYFANPYSLTSSSTATIGVQGFDNELFAHHGSGFAPLGGGILAAPAVVTLPSGDHLYIATGGDHELWERTDTQPWQILARGSCLDNPAATLQGTTLLVACQGSGHGLFDGSVPLPSSGLPVLSGWSAWGGITSAGPALAVVNGSPTMLVIGQDHRLWWRTASQGWSPLAGTWCTGHPALASSGSTAYLACHGQDNGLWYATNTGSGWSALTSLGGGMNDGPGIAATSSGPVFVVEGFDQGVWERSLTQSWQSLGGGVQHGISATGG